MPFATDVLYFAKLMRDDLILLASSNMSHNRGGTDKHLNGYSTIQFVTEIRGTLFLAYDQNEWNLTDGDWFFPAHPGPRIRFHAVGKNDNWHHRHIGFRGPLVESWRAAGLWPDAPQIVPPNQNWAQRMDETIDLVRSAGRFSRLRAINALEAIILELAQARNTNAPDLWLETVLEKLDAGVDFGDLGADLGLSPTILRRRFKAATGVTMQDYVLQKRLSAARVLLSDTDLPLKAVAAQLGYANEFFFARQFKQFTGIAPGAFRKSRI